MFSGKRYWDTVVIGGGQAGLATGYFLKKMGGEFIILDRNERAGDCWRNRWDSLKLFTPLKYNGLPGMPCPAEYGVYPGKDHMAEYFERYVKKHDLPLETGIEVRRLSSATGNFVLETSDGSLTARHVIVATGTNPNPKVPAFASKLPGSIFQIHSSSYKNPDSFPEGDVLVVGAGTSGVEIAIELSEKRKTWLSGNPTFHIPDPVFKYASGLYWWMISNVLTIKTPMGRKARQGVLKGGAPLIRVSVKDLKKAGVIMLPRVTGAKDDQVQFEGGQEMKFRTVIWATGYRPDFSWIDMKITDSTGWPKTDRGVSEIKGLYFVGMPFQYSLTSGLVGGVGRDAEYISHQLSRDTSLSR